MTDREKLIYLIGQVQDEGADYSGTFMETESPASVENYELADHLIANGVTFAVDNNVGHKWISVADEFPKQHKTVIAWTKFKEMGEAEYDGERFVWMDDDGCYDTAFATHWIPMPEPPKENE